MGLYGEIVDLIEEIEDEHERDSLRISLEYLDDVIKRIYKNTMPDDIIPYVSEHITYPSTALMSAYKELEKLLHFLTSETLKNSGKNIYSFYHHFFLQYTVWSDHMMAHFFDASAVAMEITLELSTYADEFKEDSHSIINSENNVNYQGSETFTDKTDAALEKLKNEVEQAIKIYEYIANKDRKEKDDDWTIVSSIENLYYCYSGILRTMRELKYFLANIE